VEYLSDTWEIKAGDSLLIPACCNEYKLMGKLALLKAYL
jgi:hypothetical protein